ncbi:MAG: hypothetical protein KDK39_07650 [Leptospiraceae bacterium]|nr:hypothetical protein [Leptospiraceae bacterium]
MSLRILLLTGIKEELVAVERRWHLQFNRHLHLYQSARYAGLYAGTTGPGLQRRREIRQWLNQLQPQIVVNAGLVGLLQAEHQAQVGDRVALNQLIDSRYGTCFPGGPGRNRLASLTKAAFAPHEKMDVALDFKVDVCDMEAAFLAGLLGQFDKLSESISLVLVKVIGDRPEQYLLYQNEALMRDWARLAWWRRIGRAMRFPGGPFLLHRLRTNKLRALQGLARHTDILLEHLIRHQGPGQGIDSIFIPH